MEVGREGRCMVEVGLPKTAGACTSTLSVSRGWPTFESSVAMLIKRALFFRTWPSLIDVSLRASVCKRFAPRTPDGMHKLLMEKKFTNGADREVVVKLYTNVAERCIYPAKMLDYDGFGFGDEEMKVLCEWWPKCGKVAELDLRNNAFSATGWMCAFRLPIWRIRLMCVSPACCRICSARAKALLPKAGSTPPAFFWLIRFWRNMTKPTCRRKLQMR